jgi:hypothetical protein
MSSIRSRWCRQRKTTTGEVLDALRLVLEIDPLVQAEQITAACRNYRVELKGYVRTEEERRQTELDAWALFAVDNVVNNRLCVVGTGIRGFAEPRCNRSVFGRGHDT